MAQLFGAITQSDITTFGDSSGQKVAYNLTAEHLAQVNADMEKALSVFVQGMTEDYSERYKLPGGGRMQKRGLSAQPGAVKASGSFDVAYPLEDYSDQIAGDDVTLAYMSPADYELHVQSVINRNQNVVRYEILRRLFKNTTDTFVDPLRGSLTIQALANGDSVEYPPVVGSESQATDNHYLESNYAASAISDTNNYVATMVEELEEHFGDTTGGSNIALFINPAQVGKTSVMTTFHEVQDSFIRVGANTDVPINLPNVPGNIVGRMDEGAWIVSWRWIPANYAVAIHLEQPAPLKMRVDPARTGLGRGLQLVATDTEFPFLSAFWRHRFGIGTANRLNGVIMEFGTGGTYTIPTAYQ